MSLSNVRMICWVWATCEWYVEFEKRANDMLCLSNVRMVCWVWATCEWHVVFEQRANDMLCLRNVRMTCFFEQRANDMLCLRYVQWKLNSPARFPAQTFFGTASLNFDRHFIIENASLWPHYCAFILCYVNKTLTQAWRFARQIISSWFPFLQ